jgi:hypothetical protein|tara:strand:+ start:285 stop:977 length:693 start_codon:yes stop_codon:yes gene_type:complete
MYKTKYLKYKKKYIDLKNNSESNVLFKNIANNSNLISSMIDENTYLENIFNKYQEGKRLYAESSPGLYLTYGYIKNSCIDDIIKKLEINNNDVFYDLGSGIGNVCFKISYSTNAKSIGYELVESRHEVATNINNELSLSENMKDKVKLFNDDFTKLKDGIDDATIIFTDSIMFSDSLLKQIENMAYSSPNLRYLISMKKLPKSDKFELLETASCEASWSTSQINIYKKIK